MASFVLSYPKTHPVKVEQEGSKDWQCPTGRPTKNSQTQNEEELRLWSQGATISRDRWSAQKTENKNQQLDQVFRAQIRDVNESPLII